MDLFSVTVDLFEIKQFRWRLMLSVRAIMRLRRTLIKSNYVFLTLFFFHRGGDAKRYAANVIRHSLCSVSWIWWDNIDKCLRERRTANDCSFGLIGGVIERKENGNFFNLVRAAGGDVVRNLNENQEDFSFSSIPWRNFGFLWLKSHQF